MNKDLATSQISDAGTATEIDTCADAANKIESAITLSSNFMEASRDKPTIGDIQAGDVEPAVPSAPAVPDTDVPGGILEPAVNATTLATAQLRRRALHMART